MKIILRILQWLGWLVILPMLALWVLMAWDTWRLERDIQQVATAFVLGGSPFVIPLPDHRIVLVSAVQSDSNVVCGTLAIRQGVVRSANIAGQDVALTFDRGIDLRPHAAPLQACDTLRIGITANWSFFGADFTVTYRGAVITQMGTPELWD